MNLALVVPVWNDAAPLRRLLRQAATYGCFDQIVVVDDGSDPAISAQDMIPAGQPAQGAVLIRGGDIPRGAGHARNLGLDAVTTTHLLYFDADDRLTPEIVDLIAELKGRDFDFCLFNHADSRFSVHGRWTQMPEDEAIWRETRVAVGALLTPEPRAAARLAEVANYPWNKIYRTDFLRDNHIRCTEILTHNDVELHWRSFLVALTRPGRILTSDRLCAVHYVQTSGGRLSNRNGLERLAVFPALDDLATAILDRKGTATGPLGDHPLALHFLRFTTGLFDWIAENLAPEHLPALQAASRQFLWHHVAPAAGQRLAAAGEQIVAERLQRQMGLDGEIP